MRCLLSFPELQDSAPHGQVIRIADRRLWIPGTVQYGRRVVPWWWRPPLKVISGGPENTLRFTHQCATLQMVGKLNRWSHKAFAGRARSTSSRTEGKEL
jgi:hypothetical protein